VIRVCYSRFHKGDPIFGEKPPYEDETLTHGLCPSCFEKEMEELEKRGEIKKDWKEEWREFKKNKEEINMPREKQPRKGDFVLFDNDIWIIKVRKRKGNSSIAMIESYASGDQDELLIDNLAPTDIRTWEAE